MVSNSSKGENEGENGEVEDGAEYALSNNNNISHGFSTSLNASLPKNSSHINSNPGLTSYEEKKRLFGSLNESEASSLKAFFRKALFQQLKFVSDKVTNIASNTMNHCFTLINCVTDHQKGEKYKGVVSLMEHCIMSKRNYVVKRIERKISGQYHCIIVSILLKLLYLT
jgi:hypothetical protein